MPESRGSAPSLLSASADQLRLLIHTYDVVNAGQPLDRLLNELADTAAALVGADAAALATFDEGAVVARVHRSGSAPEAPGVAAEPGVEQSLVGAVTAAEHPVCRCESDGSAWLGVPVLVHGHARAAVLAARTDGTEFAPTDEEVLTALASAAGVALDKSWADARSARSQQWLTASSRITRDMLTDGHDDVLGLIVRAVHELARAEFVTILLRHGENRLRMAVTSGGDGEFYSDLDVDLGDLQTDDVAFLGTPRRLATFEESVPPDWTNPYNVGPIMQAPLTGSNEVRGLLNIGRRRGEPEFTDADLELAATFANHVTLALELYDAHREAGRADLLEERTRIARELHDTVIQRLFAVGLGLDGLALTLPEPGEGARIVRYIGELDDTINQIRTTIFDSPTLEN